MAARVQHWWRQLGPAFLRLIIYGSKVADLPDEIVVGAKPEPRLKYTAYAEALMLRPEEAPRALQP